MDQFEKRHLAVNWVDGMLINSNHFQQLEKSINSRIAQPAGLYINANKYGLIPDAYNQWIYELDWDASVNSLHVKHCKAVTPGGWVIDIFPELNVKITPDIPKMERESSPHPEGLWAILLHIHPHEPEEIGIPDPSETAKTGTRLPYNIPKNRRSYSCKYWLHLLDNEKLFWPLDSNLQRELHNFQSSLIS